MMPINEKTPVSGSFKDTQASNGLATNENGEFFTFVC